MSVCVSVFAIPFMHQPLCGQTNNATPSVWSYSSQQLPGRVFLCVDVGTELSRIFWQGVPVDRFRGGALTTFGMDKFCNS